MGPLVLCHQPIVDYGLVKVNSQEDMEIEIENTSPIPAEILIKNSLNLKLDFKNKISLDQIQTRLQQDSSTASLIFDKPLLTKKNNQIRIDRYSMVLQPF